MVPAETSIDGNIDTPGDLTIEGGCRGEISVGGVFVVAAGASCRATVKARSAEIFGEMIGDMVCTEVITVATGGRVVGDLRAPDIAVEAGAEVDGKIDLLPPAPEAAPIRRVVARTRGPELRRPAPPPRIKT
jgi:cytoskeletal protein CcmA (bactofilin family)